MIWSLCNLIFLNFRPHYDVIREITRAGLCTSTNYAILIAHYYCYYEFYERIRRIETEKEIDAEREITLRYTNAC